MKQDDCKNPASFWGKFGKNHSIENEHPKRNVPCRSKIVFVVCQAVWCILGVDCQATAFSPPSACYSKPHPYYLKAIVSVFLEARAQPGASSWWLQFNLWKRLTLCRIIISLAAPQMELCMDLYVGGWLTASQGHSFGVIPFSISTLHTAWSSPRLPQLQMSINQHLYCLRRVIYSRLCVCVPYKFLSVWSRRPRSLIFNWSC